MKHKSLKLQILFALVLIPALGWLWTLRGQAADLPEAESYSLYLPLVSNSTLAWQEVGGNTIDGSAAGLGISGIASLSINPSIAIGPDGTPYVAYTEVIGNNKTEIFVVQWDGTSWKKVKPDSTNGGGIITNIDFTASPSLAIAYDGTIYIAWPDLGIDNWSGNREIYVRRWDGNSWVEVGNGSATGGGISNTPTVSDNPKLALAPDGTPYVAWGDFIATESAEIYIRRWDGNNWVEVGTGSASGGGISNLPVHSSDPSLAIAPNGTPYVTWSYFTGFNSEIYGRYWSGSEWEEIGVGSASDGGISNNSGISIHSSLAIAPDGTPYVSWQDSTNNYNPEIYIRRWDGTNWAEVGIGSASGGGISNNGYNGYSDNPSLSVYLDGTPYIVWEHHNNSMNEGEIYISHWDGSSWAEVGAGSASGGGMSNMGDYSGHPSLAIAPNGTPYVTWERHILGEANVYIRGWIGEVWLEVGEGSASEDGISDNSPGNSIDPSLAIDSFGSPYVAWQNEKSGEIYVRTKIGNNYLWSEIGSHSASEGGISNTSFALHPSIAVTIDGTPYIAWEDGSSGNTEIYIRQWDGVNWTEVSSYSASGGGISNTPGQSEAPMLVATQDGTLYLAWQDNSSGNEEIYVRQWDGTTWTEVGAGSASGGGISNTSDNSVHPALALSAEGVPYLAWEEEQVGTSEIYVRQWDGSNWVEVGTGSASDGGISNNAGDSLHPSLAVSGGTVYVAWEDTSSGDSQIYVRQWDGSSWVEVGTGSASGAGISLVGASTTPSIGLSFYGSPLVTWSAAPVGTCCEIYVLRWNGSQWVEVGQASANDGGISNTPGVSTHPVLAFSPNGDAYIVWEDNDSGNFEIYIRRYPLSPFPFE